MPESRAWSRLARARLRSVIAAVLAGLVLIACASPSAAAPVRLGDNVWRLPAANWVRDGHTISCAGGGLPGATIHGSPVDPTVVWAVHGGSRLRLAWPFGGYIGRFRPTLEVLDPAGSVIFREGDPITGGCETADPGVWQISR